MAGTFDGSGYHLDLEIKTDILDLMSFFAKLLPIHREFNKPTILSTVTTINNIDTYFLVDKNVRNILFLFTLYFPYENNWMSCAIVK